MAGRGHQVWRIAWDGGDFAATPSRHRIAFRGRGVDYDSFIRETIIDRHITAVVTYNDTGERNSAAIQIAKQLGLSRYILEQGYLRPHWITFDRDGVNGHSTLPKDKDFYHINGSGLKLPQAFPCRMRSQVFSTIRHFAMSMALYPFMPFDTNYYGDSVFQQAAGYSAEYVWPRNLKAQRTLVRLLEKAGVKWGSLGNDEKCCGDPAHKGGRKDVYRDAARREHRTDSRAETQEDRGDLAPLPGEFQEELRRTQGRGSHPRGGVTARSDSRRAAQAGKAGQGARGLPRPVLSRPAQRHLRCAPRGAQGHPRAGTGRTVAPPRGQSVLRRGRRTHVVRHARGRTLQRAEDQRRMRAGGAVAGHRLPVLRAHADRQPGHGGQAGRA